MFGNRGVLTDKIVDLLKRIYYNIIDIIIAVIVSFFGFFVGVF